MRARRFLTSLLPLLVLIACSTEHAAAPIQESARASQPSAMPYLVNPVEDRDFAVLPDRGELLAFDHVRRTKRSGAFTAYPVELSEAHAVNAIGDGRELVINPPAGEPIRLKYERHVEHADGNWTWIGRNASGADAVITFGAKAVFGTIPQGAGETLRLTMDAGQSWLVATDRSKLAGLGGAPAGAGSDVLIPPTALASVSYSAAAASKEPSTEATGPAAIDVLLGYTVGLANKLGGKPQAVTRLTNLIDVTNQAYVNSGVSMRVRMVGAMQVAYSDATRNDDTLEKLTGYKSGVGPITPDPAFNALRAARDQYGADVVSLVRSFVTPENGGNCGIAWLLGAGGSAITNSSAPFAYSVVSDGTDLDEGDNNTYYCRDETLAHELGHSMGQTHNVEISTGAGAHPYSYGYREASTSGFYTVMAYPLTDSSQDAIRHFANPNVSYSGRATGIANQADTVRSLNLTMPLVAGFRATVVLFADVPADYWAYTFVQRLYWSGTTSGCTTNPRNYCPTNLVARDQMAVFLLRAKHGANYSPPAATGMFQDVSTSYWAAAWIEQAVREQLVIPCSSSPARYCPTGSVARVEMALFLVRARYGAAYSPPSATGRFQDLPVSNSYAAWAEQLARDQVTLGCATSPERFCPNDPVTRDQMAAFLTRNFGL